MIRRFAVVALFAAVMAAPLHAELKYTMKMEAHKSTVAAPEAADPMMAMIASMVAGMLLPATPVETVVTVGAKGVRTEYLQPFMMLQAGSVALVKPDGSMVVFTPSEKTYWKMAKPDIAGIMAGATPQINVKKTGASATIAGLFADQSTIDIHIPLPVPAGAALPPGFPSEFVISGEMWVTPKYKEYSKQASASLLGLGAIGADKATGDGLMLRSIMRGALFGDQELETIITRIGEETVPDSAFDVPEGYREVPPPSMGIGGIGRMGGAGARRE
jgi:hypothetical protein